MKNHLILCIVLFFLKEIPSQNKILQNVGQLEAHTFNALGPVIANTLRCNSSITTHVSSDDLDTEKQVEKRGMVLIIKTNFEVSTR